MTDTEGQTKEKREERKSKRKLQTHGKRCEQQRIAKRLQKAYGVAGEQLLIVSQTYECLWSDPFPVKKAEIGRGTYRGDQYAAEEEQCRQQEENDMQFIAVLFFHFKILYLLNKAALPDV